MSWMRCWLRCDSWESVTRWLPLGATSVILLVYQTETTLNKFRIVIELDTYSEAPEEWVVDAIGDNLEEDESLVSINVETVSQFAHECAS